MQPLTIPAPPVTKPTSGAAPLDESGVHTIPRGTHDAIRAAQARIEQEQRAAQELEEAFRHPIRNSSYDVCPKQIGAHLSLVHQVVAPIARRVPANVLRDDLVAAGVFGLVDSLRKNGGDGGPTFEWYARMRIRGAVLDELRAQDWLTRRARDAVNAAAQRDEGESEAVSFVGLDELSLNEEQEYLASFERDPEAIYETKETYQHLAQALEKLPERERMIVAMHYFDGATFKQIGAKLRVSEPRISQLLTRALERLKDLLSEKTSRRPVVAEVCQDLPSPSTPQDVWVDTLPNNDSPSNAA